MNQDYDKIARYIIKEYYPKNLKIAAIKYYREATGMGLAEAKLEVEKIFGLPAKKSKNTVQTTDSGIGIVGCTFVLIFGIFMFVVAGVTALMISKRQVTRIDEKVNAISEEDRDYWLGMGCQEFITDGNYITKIFGAGFSAGRSAREKLYVFELEDNEDYYLGVFSESDSFGFYQEYCKGLAFYYDGEVMEDTVEAKDGTIYQVMIIDRDETDAIHGIPSRAVEAKKQKQVKKSLLLCIPFCISGTFLCVLGGLGIKNRKR